MGYLIQFIFSCSHAATAPFIYRRGSSPSYLDYNYLQRQGLGTTSTPYQSPNQEIMKIDLPGFCRHCLDRFSFDPYDEAHTTDADLPMDLNDLEWIMPSLSSFDQDFREIDWTQSATFTEEEPISPGTLGPGDQPLPISQQTDDDQLFDAADYEQELSTDYLYDAQSTEDQEEYPSEDDLQDTYSDPGTPASQIEDTAMEFNRWLDQHTYADPLMPPLERQMARLDTNADQARSSTPALDLPEDFADHLPPPMPSLYTRPDSYRETSPSDDSSTETIHIPHQGRLPSLDAPASLIPRPLRNNRTSTASSTSSSSQQTDRMPQQGHQIMIEEDSPPAPASMGRRNAIRPASITSSSSESDTPSPSSRQIINSLQDFNMPQTTTPQTPPSQPSGIRTLFNRMTLGPDEPQNPTNLLRRRNTRPQLRLIIPPLLRFRDPTPSAAIPLTTPAPPTTPATQRPSPNLSPSSYPFTDFSLPTPMPELLHPEPTPPIPEPTNGLSDIELITCIIGIIFCFLMVLLDLWNGRTPDWRWLLN